jgi:hypothetical protein
MLDEFQAKPPQSSRPGPCEPPSSMEDNPYQKDRPRTLLQACSFAGIALVVFFTGISALISAICVTVIAAGYYRSEVLLSGLASTCLALAGTYLVHQFETRSAARKRERLSSEIRRILRATAVRFLDALRQERPGEAMYAFLFEMNPLGDLVSAVAATEEGLDRLVQRYVSEGCQAVAGDPALLCHQWLRWPNPQAMFHTRNEGWYTNYVSDHFGAAQALLRRASTGSNANWPRWGRKRQGDETQIRLSIETLQAMDAEGEFDDYAVRERLVLGLYHNSKDADPELFLEWAAQVNPAALVERLRLEVMAGKAAGEALRFPAIISREPPASEVSF